MAEKEEDFIVSARKYRPESWKEVIGQGSITETLYNSITQDHMAHAYLFCGPRGVGKTTCARIFAKEINRSSEHDEDEDFSFNIFELDAASNNSVDDIRSLTDQVRIPPQVGNYKVYIIDEVHMLSKAAFNAFLKTLEEPPKHAIFILATTEKHKIIPTILSRCQIYDFNRINVNDIVGQLARIAENEEISFETEALHVIAQKADGAMRDALSIFDQLSSFTNNNLTYEDVLKNLHVLDYDYYFTITDHLVKQEFADVLVILDTILKLGFDGHHFIAGLGSHFRDLLVCKEPKTLALLEVGDSVKMKYQTQAQEIAADWLIEALKLVNETDFRYRNAPNTRILLETTLLTLASLSLQKKNSNSEVTPLTEPTVKKKLAPTTAEPEEAPNSVQENKTEVEAKSTPVSKEQENEPSTDSSAETETDIKAEDEEVKAEKEVEVTPPSSSDSETNKRQRRRPTTVSLKLDDEDTTEEVADNHAHATETETQPISVIAETISLEAAWKRITQEILDDGKSAMYSIMAKQDVTTQVDGSSVSIHLSHEVDEEEFNQHRSEILLKLRSYTGNQEIGLSTKRIQGKEEAKLFTPQDKFEYLAKQNPLLRKLKSDLDLDITY